MPQGAGALLASDGGEAVCLDAVEKTFGDVKAVAGVDLAIGRGEFFSILGPSGSGKTTCLRLIAGFERPSSGRVLLNGKDVTDTPPFARDVNTVFQDYALFPHMTVAQNVAYGLMVKKVSKADRERRTAEALLMVKLEDLAGRKPRELSGGQRQRVGLARALVNRPSVLLLDEPLGALDLKLRQQMQLELKSIQQQVGLTFVYVTHDQEEALTMSDRLAVMNEGRIEQVGSPAEVYERPSTGFVAGFVGVSNMIAGSEAVTLAGSSVPFTIRPEKIRMLRSPDSINGDLCRARGVVRHVIYLGASTRYLVSLDSGGELVVMQQNLSTSSMEALEVQGQRVELAWERLHNRPVAMAGTTSGSADPGEVSA